jgi:hypothetical protein
LQGDILTDISRHRVHVSVAIEGTTNSSFLAELGQIYGPEHVLVYKFSGRKFIRLSEFPYSPAQTILMKGKEILGNTPFFNQNNNDPEKDGGERWYDRRDLPENTAAVHGPFTPEIFKGIFENPFISIMLKDPLERMITLFEEWTVSKGEVDWRVSIPYDKSLKFAEFALEEDFINFQSKCLGSKRLGDFDLVGISICQDGFIAQLKNKDWTGFLDQNSQSIQFNKPRYRNLEITPEFLEQFQGAHQLDYSIYQQAKEFMGYC